LNALPSFKSLLQIHAIKSYLKIVENAETLQPPKQSHPDSSLEKHSVYNCGNDFKGTGKNAFHYVK